MTQEAAKDNFTVNLADYTGDNFKRLLASKNSKLILEVGAQYYRVQQYSLAERCYLRAAELGEVDAMSNLGYIYAYGRTGVRDDKLALQWFKRAAKLNSPIGYYKVGDALRYGNGVTQDEAQAFRFYEKALAAVHENDAYQDEAANIQLRVAQCLFAGIGVAADELNALFFVNEAQSNAAIGVVNHVPFSRNTLRRVNELRSEIVIALTQAGLPLTSA